MKNFLFLLVLVLTSLSVYAQTNRSHTVQRGETIESVANKYGITAADLQKANPDTKEFFFVGMKLTIPQVASRISQTQQVSNNEQNAQTNFYATRTSQSNNVVNSQSTSNGLKYVLVGDDGSFEEKTYNVCFDLAYVSGSKPEGYIGSPWSMIISAGVNFRITAPLYAGVRLGYMYSSADLTPKAATSYKSETTKNNLVLPVEIGYSISSPNKKFAFTPIAGIIPAVILSGKSKSMGEERKIDSGKLSISYNVGFRIRLWEYSLSAQYVFQKIDAMPGKSSKTQGSPLFSFGWGF